MLLPQYSLRRLLGIMTGCAVVFSIFAFALRGNTVAAGVSLAILSLVIVMLVHAALFAVVWLFSTVLAAMSPSRLSAEIPVDDPPTLPPEGE